MPINPQIALQTQTPQARSPITTLGALSQLREHQEVVRQRQLMNEQRERDLDDDYAVRETLGRLGNPDAAIEELYKNGRATAAGALTKQIFDWRKAKSDELKANNDNAFSKFKLLGQIAYGITDQKSLDMARPAARALLVPIFGEEGSDAMLGQLGTEYDPKRIEQAQAWATDATDILKKQQDAIGNAQRAMEIAQRASTNAREREKNMRDADEYWNKAASGYLSTAKSQQQWDQFQRILVMGGARPETLARFGNVYSPEAVANAKKLGMSTKEAADVTHQQNQDDIARRNATRQETEAKEDGPGGPASRPLTSNRKSELEEKKANAYRDLEKEIRERFLNAAGTGVEIPEEAKGEIGQRKLTIENAYRSEMGMQTLEQSELQFAADPAKRKDLDEVRRKYRQLTGQETLLAQMEALQKQIKNERNAAKQAELKQQLLTLRTTYREQMGR